MSGYTNVTVDDSAEDTFQFDGTWFMLSTGSNSAVHNDTLSEATAPGTISYYFTGNQLWVYGTVSPTKPGKPPTAVTATFDISGRSIAGASGSFTAPNTTEEQDGVLLWTSGPVDVYGYYLLINVTSATPDYPFLFDYLVFSRPPEVTSDPFSQSSTTSSPTLSIPNALTLTSTSMSHDSESSSASLSSSQAQETNAAPPSSGHHTGAIVGGVVGGLAALILGMLLLWCTRRRMRAYPSDADLSGTPTQEVRPVTSGIAGVTPFLLPRDYGTTSAGVVPPETAGPIAPRLTGVTVSPGESKMSLASTSALNRNQFALPAHQPPVAPQDRGNPTTRLEDVPQRGGATTTTAQRERPAEYPPMYSES